MEKRYCENCGRPLDRDDVKYCRVCYEEITGVDFYTQKKVERKEFIQEDKKLNNNSRNEKQQTGNEVANKFTIVVTIVQAIGYIVATVMGIMAMTSVNVFWGLLCGGLIAIATWLSTLIFEAIAEGLNLLQDIKNKL